MDINDFGDFIQVSNINKGWSNDKKYYVVKKDNTKYLLRITPMEQYESIEFLFKVLKDIANLNISICDAIEFKQCNDNIYSLYRWIDGEDMQTILPLLTKTEQYELGFKSGKMLRQIHSVAVPNIVEDWETRFSKKLNSKLEAYNQIEIKIDGDENIIQYIKENRHLLKNRPQCFHHGDYHTGNMMMENGSIVIIDFNRHSCGDPWEEFNRITFSAVESTHFATGQINGYFDNNPPMEFFKLMALYIASNTISSIEWAVKFGEDDVKFMLGLAKKTLLWFDNMKNPVPTWYENN